ncbi:UNVERIFIED_CONTAM: hypothetical protein K2H54_006782 [Gekko kuhli]
MLVLWAALLVLSQAIQGPSVNGATRQVTPSPGQKKTGTAASQGTLLPSPASPTSFASRRNQGRATASAKPTSPASTKPTLPASAKPTSPASIKTTFPYQKEEREETLSKKTQPTTTPEKKGVSSRSQSCRCVPLCDGCCAQGSPVSLGRGSVIILRGANEARLGPVLRIV